MSTRLPVKHPAQMKVYTKKGSLPTMDKEGKLMNRMYENEHNRNKLNSSIQHRLNFLHNTEMNNKHNEVSRLYNIYQTGSAPYANDQRMKLSNKQLAKIRERGTSLNDDITHKQPIIGNQARYEFV